MSKINVLFVDDEINILNAIKRSILEEDFHPLFAVNGEKALEYFIANNIAVIVTDMKMPSMNGFELLKKVKELSPQTVRIVLSGYTQLPQIITTVNGVGVFRYITKPWNNEKDFIPAINDAIEYYNSITESQILREKLESKNKLYEKGLEMNKILLNQMSKTIGNIKSVSKLMLKFQNTYIKSIKNSTSESSYLFTELIGNLYLNYLNKSLVDREIFTLNRLNEDLKNLKAKNPKITITTPNSEITADYKLIKFITIESLNFLTENYDLQDPIITLSSNPDLLIEIDNPNIQLFNFYNSNTEMQLFFAMINEILHTINGKVSFNSESVNKITISLQKNKEQ